MNISFKALQNWFIQFVMLFCFILLGCTKHKNDNSIKKKNAVVTLSTHIIIPDTIINIDKVHYERNGGFWLYNDTPYSGYIVSYYPNGKLKEKFGVLNGKKEKNSFKFYSDGHYKSQIHYLNGKRDGECKVWAADSLHILISHSNYTKGKQHGWQKKWYVTGEIFKIRNLNNGKEEGLQKAYRKNGVLYVNYEAKNGRTFGLKKSKLCFKLEEEKISPNN